MTASWGAQGLQVLKQGRRVLGPVDVTFSPGKVTAVLGPNGSGKTTLLKVLAGLLKPAAGHVTHEGVGWKESHWAMTAASVFGTSNLDWDFCVEEVLLASQFPRFQRWVNSTSELRAVTTALLERLEVFPAGECQRALERSYSSLSDGERQLVDVSRAILQPAPLLILDEPTSALDLRHRLLVREVLTDLAHREGRTVVLSLHDIAQTKLGFDEVVVLSGGLLVVQGAPSSALTPELMARVWRVREQNGEYQLLNDAGDRT